MILIIYKKQGKGKAVLFPVSLIAVMLLLLAGLLLPNNQPFSNLIGITIRTRKQRELEKCNESEGICTMRIIIIVIQF